MFASVTRTSLVQTSIVIVRNKPIRARSKKNDSVYETNVANLYGAYRLTDNDPRKWIGNQKRATKINNQRASVSENIRSRYLMEKYFKKCGGTNRKVDEGKVKTCREKCRE